jgi:hypothetical protein
MYTRLTKQLAALALIVVFAVMTSTAFGTLFVSETFSHPDGSLAGQSPEVGGTWVTHSGTGVVPVSLVSGQAQLTHGSGSRDDVNAPFAGGAVIGAGDIVYSGFDLSVADPGAAIVDVNFAHFLAGTSLFGARLWVSAPTTSGYRLALSGDSSITDGDGEAFWGADLSFGTTYRVVTSYNYDDGDSRMWIDPVTEASSSVTSTDGFAMDEFASYALRQAGGNTMQLIDNLRVATTFAQAVAIPEPGAALFGGLVCCIVGAAVGWRRILGKQAE